MNKTIFIIDDNEKIIKMLTFLFETKGFLIETAKDGMEALEKLEIINPGVIIVDMMMPRMNGMEFCEIINKKGTIKSLPVIVLSFISAFEIKEKLLTLGICDYVEKPFTSRELLNKVAAALHLNKDLSH